MSADAVAPIPSILWAAPFAALLLAIAVLPLLNVTGRWWHHNKNKLFVALGLGAITLAYYHLRGFGYGHGEQVYAAGWPTTLAILRHAVLAEYAPFLTLLFSLYVISGGIRIRGDIPAHPLTNVGFLAAGGVLASLIGTTGASMVLIRPLLKANSERKHVAHTVVFFIFIVSNIGGCLLPIGDPPLFLGYLRGVPFFWTLHLWKEWAFAVGILLFIYYLWDLRVYHAEGPVSILRDELEVEPLALEGGINFVWLAGVLFVTGTLGPTKPFPWAREMAELAFVGLSLGTTPRGLRQANEFNYGAIIEVACLFLGIFLCMQVPIEILYARGASLGIDTPAKLFWATGGLSSFLDNAPTYVVFFETANAMTHAQGSHVTTLLNIRPDHLAAISLGAVFMGANTYIGNGPNFMVKSIAEHAGVRMPSFFGYMAYSACILLPLFVLITMLFIR